jgi:hypothetical protein
MVEFYEHGNKLSGSKKTGKFLTGWVTTDLNFSRKTLCHRVRVFLPLSI